MTIINWCKQNTWAVWVSGIALLILAFFIMRNQYAQEKADLTNMLANKDSLHTIVQNANGTLSARLANVQQDFEKEVASNAILKEYKKKQDAKIVYLASTVSEFKLENERIRGTLDSSGAIFDTVTHDYSLKTHVTYYPPLMQVLNLNIMDSSFVLLAQKGDGLLEGAISHSNPFIRDLGAKFQYRYGTVATTNNWVNNLEWGSGGLCVGGVASGNIKVAGVGLLLFGVIEGVKAIF